MVLTVYSTLSPAIGLVVTVAGAMRKHRRQRDVSVETSGPHGLAVRLAALVWRDKSSTASCAQRFVTVAKRPSCGHGTRKQVPAICPTAQVKCLRHIGTTGKSV
jgi:hypothetical protein